MRAHVRTLLGRVHTWDSLPASGFKCEPTALPRTARRGEDADGEIWVKLPEYFQALNRDFQYQLTSIGAPAPSLHIADEISGNRFRIAGGSPGGKVSWQVTGVRKDPFAEKHRFPAEEEKPPAARGYYLYPDVYSQPETRSTEWARNAGAMRRALEDRDWAE